MSSYSDESHHFSASIEQASNQDEEYIVDNMSVASTTSKASREFDQGTFSEQSSKRQRNTESAYTGLPYRPQPETPSSFPSSRLAARNMSDGSTFSSSSISSVCTNHGAENEARAIRVLEIMNDFRTLQQHITAQVTRTEATPTDQAAYYLDGYVILRQASADAQTILSMSYNPGSLGLDSAGRVPDTEVQKATLQRYKIH